MAWRALVTLDTGPVYRFSTHDLDIVDVKTGDTLHFTGGIEIGSIPGNGEGEGSDCEIVIPQEILDWKTVRASGINVGTIAAEVSLWQEGDDYAERDARLVGRVTASSEARYDDRVELTIGAAEELSDRQFPPWTITREDFPDIDSGQVGKTIPIIYGNVKQMPLTPLSPAANGATGPAGTSDWMIGYSAISSTRIAVERGGNPDDTIAATVGTTPAPKAGCAYSRVSLSAVDIFGMGQATADIAGKPGPGGAPITGLGDVVVDAIRSFSGLDNNRIDWRRLSRFQSQANRAIVSAIFGGAEPGPSLAQTLSARFGQDFPARIGWRGGRLGADWLSFDRDMPLHRPMRLGGDLLERVGKVGPWNEGELCSYFAVEYDHRILSDRYLGRVTAEPGNDERCKTAASHLAAAGRPGGRVVYPTVGLPDIVDEATARLIIEWLVSVHAVPRTEAIYRCSTDLARFLPLYERYDLTDEEMGWTDVRFVLHAVKWDPEDLDLAELVFVSLGESP